MKKELQCTQTTHCLVLLRVEGRDLSATDKFSATDNVFDLMLQAG